MPASVLVRNEDEALELHYPSRSYRPSPEIGAFLITRSDCTFPNKTSEDHEKFKTYTRTSYLRFEAQSIIGKVTSIIIIQRPRIIRKFDHIR